MTKSIFARDGRVGAQGILLALWVVLTPLFAGSAALAEHGVDLEATFQAPAENHGPSERGPSGADAVIPVACSKTALFNAINAANATGEADTLILDPGCL